MNELFTHSRMAIPIPNATTFLFQFPLNFSFGQKWKTGTGKQYFTDIVGQSSTTVT